ncbi:MAG: MmcQ/YjbR family DNA-binding protein [Flavobacteriales bacterium]|nr:MmcQ/YjbR family DNA-binding protein [Flavobacteriales bacterium]
MSNSLSIDQLALSFPETTAEPHFEKVSYRVRKKIFATRLPGAESITVKLSAIDQDVFVSVAPDHIAPVTNKWGKQGWTEVAYTQIHPDMLRDVLTTAYCTVAPEVLASKVRRAD